MGYSLATHPKQYEVSASDVACSLLTVSGATYADRHCTLSKTAPVEYRLGHTILSVVLFIPGIGLLAAIVERIVAYFTQTIKPLPSVSPEAILQNRTKLLTEFKSTPPDTSKKSRLEQTSRVLVPHVASGLTLADMAALAATSRQMYFLLEHTGIHKPARVWESFQGFKKLFRSPPKAIPLPPMYSRHGFVFFDKAKNLVYEFNILKRCLTSARLESIAQAPTTVCQWPAGFHFDEQSEGAEFLDGLAFCHSKDGEVRVMDLKGDAPTLLTINVDAVLEAAEKKAGHPPYKRGPIFIFPPLPSQQKSQRDFITFMISGYIARWQINHAEKKIELREYKRFNFLEGADQTNPDMRLGIGTTCHNLYVCLSNPSKLTTFDHKTFNLVSRLDLPSGQKFLASGSNSKQLFLQLGQEVVAYDIDGPKETRELWRFKLKGEGDQPPEGTIVMGENSNPCNDSWVAITAYTLPISKQPIRSELYVLHASTGKVILKETSTVANDFACLRIRGNMVMWQNKDRLVAKHIPTHTTLLDMNKVDYVMDVYAMPNEEQLLVSTDPGNTELRKILQFSSSNDNHRASEISEKR